MSQLLGRLATQFVAQNRGLLASLDVEASVSFDGNDVSVALATGTTVGAVPLVAPTSGRTDLGLVVSPRFSWSGLGIALCETGWKVLPEPLRLPSLPKSERKIPAWVMSSVVLSRFESLLNSLTRAFSIEEHVLQAPRGQVIWPEYLARSVTKGNFHRVPCRFPVLADDRVLVGAIHHSLRIQLASLESQRSAGRVVQILIQKCNDLLRKVRHVEPRALPHSSIQSLIGKIQETTVFRDGIEALDWTVNERGLAGLSDWQGLPWALKMDSFFEAWVETLAQRLSQQIGGVLRVGRRRETVAPLHWEPSFYGSQKYLLPDLILEREDDTIIFDAKYKSHWEELSDSNWMAMGSEIRERHRQDLLQVIAYSSISQTPTTTCCLVYPCKRATWESLKSRDRTFHTASVASGSRLVRLVLAAVPLTDAVAESVPFLARALDRSVAEFG